MACLQKVQENCKFDEYDFRRHELVYEAIQAYGGPQRLQEDMKDTMEHMRRVRIAQQAVLAERAMAAALGVERESSLSPGVKTISCAYKPLPAHLELCGGVMDATGLKSETEARI
ncbi:Hypothetical Protein FCC1311_005262 [Hondaea fermentalgiana]|uniref:Uncharacterized protein n=1 Tax=Hondaea fermentalgiana TaxID=2315210 RepID=A0A2R5G3H9_9STRA|nr:Hypothetical Protein FCC1311_005262 [Hondaea fermentalgiana]|eukprot:GBG24308.1 Hypothetical Protein FCC1311_005262 [Hondaea fermentalgiana]